MGTIGATLGLVGVSPDIFLVYEMECPKRNVLCQKECDDIPNGLWTYGGVICDQLTDSGIDAESESIPYSSLGEIRS